MSTPEEPRNARLVDRDGVEYPVDLVYLGEDETGMYLWAIIPSPEVPSGCTQLRTDTLPARTAITSALPPSSPAPRDACVCGCDVPGWNGERAGLEEPGVCMCGHYLYLHWQDRPD